jgi:hypothetical protein
MGSEALACRIGAGLSTSQSAWEAATEAARAARGGGGGRDAVDLAFLFLSPAHLNEVEAAVEAVHEELAPRHLLGCVAEGVVAGVRELEQGPAVAVWAGAPPGAEIECFHAAAVQTEDGIAVAGFPELDDPELVALLADPFTFPAGPFLTSLNEAHERVPLVGGIAAGGRRPGAQALILDDAVHSEAAVGAVVSGPPVFTVVSQGCRRGDRPKQRLGQEPLPVLHRSAQQAACRTRTVDPLSIYGGGPWVKWRVGLGAAGGVRVLSVAISLPPPRGRTRLDGEACSGPLHQRWRVPRAGRLVDRCADLVCGTDVHLYACGISILDRGEALLDCFFEREPAPDHLVRGHDAVCEQPNRGGEVFVPHV